MPAASGDAFGWKALAAVAVTLVFWSSAFVGIRAGLAGYEAGHLALLRFLTASAVLGTMAVAKGLRPPPLREVPTLFLHGFLGFTVYHAALNYGERTVSAASACFLIVAIPVFTALLAVVFLGERLKRRAVAGILVAVVGVGVISLGESGGLGFDWGVLLVLLAALSESVFMILQKPWLKRYSALEYVTWTAMAGTVFLLFWAPGLWTAVMSAPLSATVSGVYLGIGPAAIAYVTWAYALARADVSKVVAAQYLLPPLTLVIGLVWLGEWPPWLALAGGALILLGVVLISAPDSLLRRLRLAGTHAPVPVETPGDER